MDKKYLLLLAQKFPTIDSAASEIVNLSAIRSMPKGTEYFFSDIHGEYEAFLHMLKSASGMIKNKIDLILGKTVSSAEREALAYLIYYPDKQLKRLRDKNGLSDEWRRLTIYRLILVCEAVSAKYTRSRVRKSIPKDMVYILDELLNVTDDVVKEYYYDEIITTILDTGIADRFIYVRDGRVLWERNTAEMEQLSPEASCILSEIYMTVVQEQILLWTSL